MALNYEDFIRTAFDQKSRTLENGADADLYRGLERSFAEYIDSLNKEEKPTKLDKSSSSAYINYKQDAKKISEFVIGALIRYETSFHLNSSQIEKLAEIRQQLVREMTLDKIESCIENATNIMKPKLQVHISADGFLNSPAYAFHAAVDFKKYIHQFGDLKELEIKLHEVPFADGVKYPSVQNEITFDGKKLTVIVEAKRSSTGLPKKFEILNNIEILLSNAVQFYKEFVEANV